MKPTICILFWLFMYSTAFWFIPISKDEPSPDQEDVIPKELEGPRHDTKPLATGNTSNALDVRAVGIQADQVRGKWPVNNNFHHILVRYCWANEDAKLKSCGDFTGALSLWKYALGGVASAATGHDINFREETIPGTNDPLYCYSDWQHDSWQGIPNPDLKDRDVLHVYWKSRAKSGGVTSATTGYEPFPGRKPGPTNRLTIGEGSSRGHIAHEIGHVLGMNHEVQHNDAANHIVFKCENLFDYEEIAEFAGENEGITVGEAGHRLCTDWGFAFKYKFAAAQWLPNPDFPPQSLGQFDVDSIMMYGSDQAAGWDSCTEAKPDHCPVAKIKRDEQGKEVGLEYIHWKGYPSAKDAAWMRATYPWSGHQSRRKRRASGLTH